MNKMPMKRVLIGGPLLGERESVNRQVGFEENANRLRPQRKSFAPLITPLIGVSKNAVSRSTSIRPERFVLLPHDRFIQVLAAKTGKVIANFVPFPAAKSKLAHAKIESVCLATYPTKPHSVLDVLGTLPEADDTKDQKDTGEIKEEDFEDHAVIVACSDGTLREFPLLVLLPTFLKLQQEFACSSNCGPFELAGPTYSPRRIFEVGNYKKLGHIAAPACVSRAEYGILVYAVSEWTKKEKGDTSVFLLRFLLPPYYNNSIMESKKGTINLQSPRVHKLGKFHCRHGDRPLGLEAVVRDSTRAVSSPSNDVFLRQTVYIVVARPKSLVVYGERLSDIGLNGTEHVKKLESVSFGFHAQNPLSAMSISVNKSDIACGFSQGDIVIKSNLLAIVDEYHRALAKYEKQTDSAVNAAGAKVSRGGTRKPEHPLKNVIDARVHWHAHPVTSLCYDRNSPPSDPILYSGGDESVLVTWQLSRGINRPSDVLPRLAQRGISHIVCPRRAESANYSANDSILVYCEDNTLQLFEAHGKGLLWKVPGVASITSGGSASITCDPKSSAAASPQVIFSALPDAPGMMQWYDTRQQQVVADLEIAPYNRVSRMDQNEKIVMPAPTVTHFAITKSGNDLVTIDKVPTENKFVGFKKNTTEDGDDDDFGYVTTVKFWTWNASAGARNRKGSVSAKKPYDLVAAMVHPHGHGNTVASSALSASGKFACTVSNDEKAFRLWEKVDDSGEEASGRRHFVWVCQCKVTTPAGYANHATGSNAVAFSSDSSIIAICYGHMVTLWDRNNMTLLTCLDHLNGTDAVESIQFIEHDMLLCWSPGGVSLLSPFAQNQRDVGWSWTALGLPDETVSCAQTVASHTMVAVSIYSKALDVSRIVLFDIRSGRPVRKKKRVLIEQVDGKVLSVGQPGTDAAKESNWRVEGENAGAIGKRASLVFHVLTSRGVLISLREHSSTTDASVEVQAMVGASQGNVPRLPSANLATSNEPPRKRRRVTPTKSIPQDPVRDKKLAMSSFGSILEESGKAVPLPTSELPTLSGDFARAFVGRNLFHR